MVKNALELADYRIDFAAKTSDLSTLGGKIDALRKILPVVVDIKKSARRSEYCKKISARLALDEDIVRQEWIE